MATKKKAIVEKKTPSAEIYKWQGTNRAGLKVKGEIAGTSLALIKIELRRQGIIPTKVTKQATGLFAPREKKIKTADITVFARQLATMMSSGIPLAQSFDIVGRGHDNPSMRKLIGQIKIDVEAGNNLADAFRKHPKYFNDLFCNLISAGEQSGSLETMLHRLAIYLEKSQTIKKKIKKAMTYPISVLIITLIVSSVLLVFVVPQFSTLFTNAGSELPALTKVVVAASEVMQKWWWIVFLGLGISIYTFLHLLKTSESFAYAFDKYLLRFIIIGPILNKAIIARYARTLATTFAAGMPLVDALSAVSGAAGNRVYAKAILKIRDDVSTGIQLQQSMRDSQLFPNMVVQMVAIGEESGALETMLSKVADYYEEMVDTAVDSLSTLMEPIIMCVLAVLIGGMVVAMYLPIFQLGNVAGRG